MDKIKFFIFLYTINLKTILSLNNCETNRSLNSSSDCHIYTQHPNYCCYYSSTKNNNTKFCKTVPYSSLYYNNLNYENIDGELYKINCGTISNNDKEITLLEQCGNINDANNANFEKCKKYSTNYNSCCYAKGNNEVKKGCYYLGTKYEGDVTWAKVDLECNMNYLKYTLFYLFFIFLFF